MNEHITDGSTVTVMEPPPVPQQVPVLFYFSLAVPVFAALFFLMYRLFPGPQVRLEENPDDQAPPID